MGLLSVVVPTRDEAANIAACLGVFAGFEGVETVVVDNHSGDGTADLARQAGASKVLTLGPERSAQRNAGWRAASGEYVLFLDADMILPRRSLECLLEVLGSAHAPDALYVPEVRIGGKGWWTQARNLERSFYDGTVVDALRVVRRGLLEQVGGYDESLVSCEDWDLDRRLLALGIRTGVLGEPLLHNEGRLTFRRHLAKKAYYSGSFEAYLRKWGWDEVSRRQFSPLWRYCLWFVRGGRWRRAVRHPILMGIVYFERVCVGVLYLTRPRHRR
ncbi:MAG: glycosyltransferase [Kiritimatiellia bacterium]